MHQSGLDLQVTSSDLLMKLESLSRWSSNWTHDHWAVVTGFEYTFSQPLGLDLDLGILAEYLFDSRGSLARTPFEDDIFLGLRLTGNDYGASTLLAGVVLDRVSRSYVGKLEASRRFGSNWKLASKGGLFGTSPSDPLHAYRASSFMELELSYYFVE